MATRGAFVETTWVNGAAPGISAQQLQRVEDQIKVLDEIWDGDDLRPTGDLIPSANNSSSLGDTTYRWRGLYLYDLFDEAGVRRWNVNGSIYLVDGSQGAAAFAFADDTDTGMYRSATNRIGFTTGGTLRMAISSTDIDMYRETTIHSNLYIDPISDTANSPNVYISPTNGRLYHSTSARKTKANIAPADRLADLPLTPVTYTTLNEHERGKSFVGFIADDMPDERMIQYDGGGEPVDYDTRAVLAVLAAKVNRLDTRLEKVNA